MATAYTNISDSKATDEFDSTPESSVSHQGRSKLSRFVVAAGGLSLLGAIGAFVTLRPQVTSGGPLRGSAATTDLTNLNAAAPVAGTKLFCFMVVSTPSEQAFANNSEITRSSIFNCEFNKIYDALDNTDYTADFHSIWGQVFADKLYQSADWTVKVDPNTVWSPSRLRSRLQVAYTFTVQDEIYFQNSVDKTHFVGPIQILSKAAVDKMQKGFAACPVIATAAENVLMKACLVGNSVTAQLDAGILKENWGVWNCGADYVAFSPFGTVEDYNQCFYKLQLAKHP